LSFCRVKCVSGAVECSAVSYSGNAVVACVEDPALLW
jgi:hypothetical protein